VQTDAQFAKFTREAGETVIQGGTRLSSSGRDYVSVSGAPATVIVSGDQVQASGDAANTYRVFAPQNIASVLVNGAPVATCRNGSYLLLPCSYGPL
jgi:aspartate 1-decarboxylase